MADEQTNAESQLFAYSRLCIIISDGLDSDTATQLAIAIRELGGEVVLHQLPDAVPPVAQFTHFVSSTINFLGHDEVCDELIPVVKPGWVNTSISKNKLANTRQYNPDPRLFLNDVVVSCHDLPEGDKDAIIGGVLAMGGLYNSKITRTTTHLVVLSIDSEKCMNVIARRLDIKIVLPHWFDDCLKLGKRIDERPYMFPDPEILRVRPDAPIRSAENKDIIGASAADPKSLSCEIQSDLNVFAGKTVMLSEDLAITDRISQSIREVIIKGGGHITSNVQETDIFVCRYREGEEYRAAFKLGKEVGNLSWLYHLITHNAWISPLRRLLHYPLAKDGIPGFQGFKISLSNYAGEARIYLENLIAATGAECTKTLKQDNTHLITAHSNSEKCTAAKEWNIHVVNHLWLEDSYSKWHLQSVSAPRYTHFPLRTNLGEIVGHTRINRQAIEDNFLASHATETAIRPRNNNLPANHEANSTENNASKSKAAKKDQTSITPKIPKATKALNKAKDGQLLTPQISKFIADGKENATPSTTGSRKSKDVAAARLHEIAPDIALYEKEKKRAGGVIYGGRRKSDQSEKPSGRKRSIEPEDGTDDEDANEAKKPKQYKVPIVMHLMLTGFRRWAGKAAKLEEVEKRQLRNLGILVTQDARKCTHLAAPSILRTHKFVNALAYAPTIVNVDFVHQCLDKDELLNPSDFILHDPVNEKKHNFTLEEARLRALENKNQLLDGMVVYCVEKINGGFEPYKSIVENNGGQCVMFRGRSGIALPNRRASQETRKYDEGPDPDEVFLISGAEKDQAKLWRKFRNMVLNAKKTPRIVRPDWLLNMAMAQEWRWDDSLELKEEDVLMADD
ncbi:hypothetical protein FQN55_001837 [Onygenales sp. PD_40]|nr:hypothetical protein FQN55_001837 [Onygenales sp. PD_40]